MKTLQTLWQHMDSLGDLGEHSNTDSLLGESQSHKACWLAWLAVKEGKGIQASYHKETHQDSAIQYLFQ